MRGFVLFAQPVETNFQAVLHYYDVGGHTAEVAAHVERLRWRRDRS